MKASRQRFSKVQTPRRAVKSERVKIAQEKAYNLPFKRLHEGHWPCYSQLSPCTPIIKRELMEKEIADELIRVLKKNESSDFEESFERAFELTKAYAASANAQASAIPFVFEKMFELFVCGKTVK